MDNFAIHNLDELLMYFNATLDEAGDLTKDLVDHTLTAINFDEIEGITNFISNISHEFVENDQQQSIAQKTQKFLWHDNGKNHWRSDSKSKHQKRIDKV